MDDVAKVGQPLVDIELSSSAESSKLFVCNSLVTIFGNLEL